MKSRQDFKSKHKVDIENALKMSLQEQERENEKKAIEMSIREQAEKEKEEDLTNFFKSLKNQTNAEQPKDGGPTNQPPN